MFNTEILKYIVSPGNKNPLYFDNIKNKLIDQKTNFEFETVEGIPVLIEKNSSNTESFDYVDHYTKDAEFFNYFRKMRGPEAFNRKKTKEIILRHTKKENQTVLDVGSGRAWVAGYFIKTKNSIVISFDLALKNTIAAQKIYPSENHFAVAGDALNPPFKNAIFDYIIASEIIEHIIDPGKFVSELFCLLKPGGKLIITTPYKEKLSYSTCIHCNKKTPHNAHIHSFDKETLKSLYSGPNLKDIKIKTYHNKLIELLRLYTFINFFPFSLWRLIDMFFNLITRKPNRFLIIYEKKDENSLYTA